MIYSVVRNLKAVDHPSYYLYKRINERCSAADKPKDYMRNGSQLVVVYGTLMKGGSNHAYLSASKYVGSDTLSSIVLYHLGDYPGAVLQNSEGVEVEVYMIDAETLRALDELEEVNYESEALGLYRRALCSTQFGQAWIYLYNKDISGSSMQIKGRWYSR